MGVGEWATPTSMRSTRHNLQPHRRSAIAVPPTPHPPPTPAGLGRNERQRVSAAVQVNTYPSPAADRYVSFLFRMCCGGDEVDLSPLCVDATASSGELPDEPAAPQVGFWDGSNSISFKQNSYGRDKSFAIFIIRGVFLIIIVQTLVVWGVPILSEWRLHKSNHEYESPQRRPIFTQFWSTGHIGTRFLTELFLTSSVRNKSSTNKALFWNEDSIYLGPKAISQNLTLRQYQQHVGVEKFLSTVPKTELDIEFTCRRLASTNTSEALAKMGKEYESHYKHYKHPRHVGKQCAPVLSSSDVYLDANEKERLKQWNNEGDIESIGRYLLVQRAPALAYIAQRYQSDGLEHMIQIGHTAVFYDLPSYYDALQKAGFDTTWGRIKRKRIYVARSFAQDLKGKRPGPCESGGSVTCPWYQTSVLKPSRAVWNSWSIFQQYLWFVDEMEARWLMFVSSRTEVQDEMYTLNFSPTTDRIEPESIDELAVFLNVPSPRSIMDRIPHRSHIKGSKMSETVMELEAEEYSDAVPWCQQNSLESPVEFELDCGVDAY